MAIYAVVNSEGGIVTNVVVGNDLESVKNVVGDCVEVTDETGSAGPGYVWDGLVFTQPTT